MSHIDPNGAYIVAAVRSPIARAFNKKDPGALASLRPDDLLVQVLTAALGQVPTLQLNAPTDIIVGTAFPEGEQGFNIARKLVPLANLPLEVTGQTVNRWCASGLQAIVTGFSAVLNPFSTTEVVLAGGVEMMSRIPLGGNAFRPNPRLTGEGQDYYLSMGLTAEAVVQRYAEDGTQVDLSRENQDRWAVESHRRAIAARSIERPHIVPITLGDPGDGRELAQVLTEDDGPRADTSPEALARLKPAFLFDGTGTVTAGNSSQVSDGAAMTIVVSGRIVEEYGLTPLARLVSSATVGNEPRYMGVAPIKAIPAALEKAGLRKEDLGLIGLNEAFAAQFLAVQQVLELDPAIINVNGGAIAIGHPLGCTGARDTADQLHEAIRRQVRYFGVGMCVGGGQGMFAIFENVHPSLHLTSPSTPPSAEDA